MSWLALDVGGANLKAADGVGFAVSRPFALWREPARLGKELSELLSASPPHRRIAVTMTGELCDCFDMKSEGVLFILDAVEVAAGETPISVYLTDGRLADATVARRWPHLAAASNWHAVAAFCGRFAGDGPAILVDFGSTTADVIPLVEAGPMAEGRCDTERLACSELVYTGVERTPLMAVVDRLPWRGRSCTVAAELFATTADAYLLLSELPEDGTNVNTADGRPRTRANARSRLARMVGADAASFSEEDAFIAAQAIRAAQLASLHAAVAHVAARFNTPPNTVIISGQGEFLLRELTATLPWRPSIVSLSEELGSNASQCAPAHALAVLAREREDSARA
jgi:(4-(4-[2-(gamma-L-glutamylamino)ethyl]phenoxymethyl)furan-2-yl)methanamine synthase